MEPKKYQGYFPEIPKLSLPNIARACRVKPSKQDIMQLFNCRSETLEGFCKNSGFLNFEHLRITFSTNARDMLMQKAIDLAMDGDKLALRLCLINICGWADSLDQKIQKLESESKNYTPEQVLEKLKNIKQLQEELLK